MQKKSKNVSVFSPIHLYGSEMVQVKSKWHFSPHHSMLTEKRNKRGAPFPGQSLIMAVMASMVPIQIFNNYLLVTNDYRHFVFMSEAAAQIVGCIGLCPASLFHLSTSAESNNTWAKQIRFPKVSQIMVCGWTRLRFNGPSKPQRHRVSPEG